MDYNITIEYTNNPARAGKLSLTSQDGRVILSKVPVAVPPGAGVSFRKTGLKISVLDKLIKQAPESVSYANALLMVKENNVEVTVKASNGEVLFAPQKIQVDGERLTGDTKLFILKDTDFKILTNTMRDNKVSMSVEQVGFLWFPEKINPAKTSRKDALDFLANIEAKALNKKDEQLVSSDKKSSLSSAAASNNRILKKEEVSSAKGKITEQPKTTIKQPNNIYTSQGLGSKTSVNRSSNPNGASSRSTSYNGDDLDAFDMFFMYNNPDLALFYKPNSLFAWMTYFGRDTSNLSRDYVNENINNVSGFENVGSADLKYTQHGYSVDLYEDETKQKSLGKLVYEANNECYRVVSPTGESTYLQQEDNGVWNGCTDNANGKTIDYNFVETSSGYAGNWTTDAGDKSVTSGMTMGYDFQPESTLAEPVNLDSYIAERNMGGISIDNVQTSSTYETAPTYDNSYTPSYDAPAPSYNYTPEPEPEPTQDWRNDPPPPPPPPPPEDGQWASSQDSYSSFRM